MRVCVKFSATMVLIALLAISCHLNTNRADSSKILQRQVVRLGKSGMILDILKSYKVKENVGPDFVIYYISPIDSLKENIGNLGLYMGGYPHLFIRDYPNKQVDSVKSLILKTNSTWTILMSQQNFIAETLVDPGGDFKFNAFAVSKDRANLDILIGIFKTLKGD